MGKDATEIIKFNKFGTEYAVSKIKIEKATHGELKRKHQDMVDAHGYIKKIDQVNTYNICLLIGVIVLFSVSLFMMAFGYTGYAAIHELTGYTIAAFVLVIPGCYYRFKRDLSLNASYEQSVNGASKKLVQYMNQLTNIDDKTDTPGIRKGAPIQRGMRTTDSCAQSSITNCRK